MSTPKVSVLMAVYNAMPYLPEAVESVLSQTLSDFQFVIVDDGSTDGASDWLSTLEDPRVQIVTQPNAGLAAALNRGLEECKAPYVARMDADDRCPADRLMRQAGFLDSHPQVGCVGCQTSPFGDAQVGGSLNLPSTHQDIRLALEEGRHALVHPSVMMRTALVRSIGGYWPYRLVSEDHDLFLRLSEAAEMANLSPVLYHMRYHMGSINGSNMLAVRRGIDYARMLAVRRREGLTPISFAQYSATRDSAPLNRRFLEWVDAYARSSYRAGIGDFYGNRRWRGRARLALAAALAPGLTVRRVLRMLRRGRAAQDDSTAPRVLSAKDSLTA